MSAPTFYPRSIERRLAEALEDSPVVLIHGPRQCGKTTLAQFTCAPNYLTWGGDRLSYCSATDSQSIELSVWANGLSKELSREGSLRR